ncbi:uncharacterized protein F4822DRAFT_303362 [Hypoxylon trugodes]|uniref:uncharacterized protein n=1 Tax=Hypoxylon trugodes TaxID=326681 RepID=UPI002194540F|nr:uncharacterized protein F4822DRAFT_303362 [Hypoxylon trugodes]KAI1388134.1 hypothetical protein F4822DRAFT_303362 [Hypoxylon trugodes]
MKAIFAIFGVLVGVTWASPLLTPLKGYTIVPMTWLGINTTDGLEIAVSGTIQEIQSQVQSMNDSIVWKMSSTQQSIKPRSKKNIVCNSGGDGGADNVFVQQGIDYLKSIKNGPCGAPPGPNKCSRISCSYGAGIFLCNDTPKEIHHDCPDLATYAEDIRSNCHTEGVVTYVRGQQFDTEGFSVVVGHDQC